jgi:hypothetical protein
VADVTGRLADAVGVYDPDIDLRLIFTLPGAAVTANRLIHSRPIVVDEFTEPDGEFTVNLVPTTAMTGIDGRDVYYDVKIERRGSGADYMPWDDTTWKLRVPAEGGKFHELVDLVVGNDIVAVGPDLVDPDLRTGFQFNTVTGDLYERVVVIT